VTPDGLPVVVYQGGLRTEFTTGQNCNPGFQGDLMVNIRSGGVWNEYLGIQGDASLKNGMLPDGMVGKDGDVAVDRDGNIHMIGQHHYEWCDLNAINNPDLLYVRQSPEDLGNFDVSMEEAVDEINLYGTGGGVQSAMGYHCRLILDNGEPQQPIAFYAGRVSGGRPQLRASFREGDNQWRQEVIHDYGDSNHIIDYISPAIAADGSIGVAYFLKQVHYEEGDIPDHLWYAQRLVDEEGNVTWEKSEVDYQSYCGNYCSLAFDRNNMPAIAYYDERAYTPYRERHNVKLAYLAIDEVTEDETIPDEQDPEVEIPPNTRWVKENVAFHGRIGFSNALWFDGNNIPNVASYQIEVDIITQEETHSVVVFRRDRELNRHIRR